MARTFKISAVEAIMTFGKIRADLINAIEIGSDYSDIISDKWTQGFVSKSGDDLDAFLDDYTRALTESVKPVYLKALRASMRSTRSRQKKMLGTDKPSSMTLDIALKDDINALVAFYNDSPENKGKKRLFQVDIVRMAIDDLMLKEMIDK